MMQRIIAWTMGGISVAAIGALGIIGIDPKPSTSDGRATPSDTPVSVVIEQSPLSEAESESVSADTSTSGANELEEVKEEVDAEVLADRPTENAASVASKGSAATQDPEAAQASTASTVNSAPTEGAEATSTKSPSVSASEVAASAADASTTATGEVASDEQTPHNSSEENTGNDLSSKEAQQDTQLAILTPAENVAEPISEAQVAIEVPEETGNGEQSEPEPAREIAALPDQTDEATTPVQAADEANTDGANEQQGASETTDPTPEEAPETAATEEDTAEPSAEETVADPGAPTLDVVRVDRDGQTVIAGRAEPDKRVEVLLDGEIVGETTADASGQFVAVVFASLTDAAQKLELRTTLTAPAEALQTEKLALSEPSEVAVEPELSDEAPTISLDVKGLADPASISGSTLIQPSSNGQTDTVTRGSGNNDLAAGLAATNLAAPAVSAPETRQRYALSAPVIILPSASPDAAPTLVQPRRDTLALLQPAEREVVGVVLDSITYDDAGAVILSGRGVVERVIRIYANGEAAGTARVDPDGRWVWASDTASPEDIKLFRMDELGPEGGVTSRVETPFTYSRFSPKLVQDRRVVVQWGDALWRIAEQFYGEGIRYSMIYGANTELIRDPDLIYPGQVFTIPELVDAD